MTHDSRAFKQFLLGKRKMLAEFRRTREHALQLPVPTSHGVTAEAALRDWLAGFLPRRFAITSGYIRSQQLRTKHDFAHFDVIIYDQLRSPVLWTEENADKSAGGQSRIIPAEYVYAVLEVKASLTTSSARDAAAKLHQLDPLISAVDLPLSRYPSYLPSHTVLGLVFFEIGRSTAREVSALEIIRDLSTLLRPFYGAIALSGEGRPDDDAGHIRILSSATPLAASGTTLLDTCVSPTTPHDGKHLASFINWSDEAFSTFAFDLLAIMEGRFDYRYMSSWYGFDFGFEEHPGA